MIKLESVTKRYDDVLAVDDISLHVKKGEIFGLLEPNGAGKSTMISMLSGQTLADSGDLSVGGYLPSSNDAKRLLGVAPQSTALYEDLSALDNLQFFGSLYRLSREKLAQRCEEVLEFTGLSDRAKDRVSNYSGGMKRRLNLAATLLHEPEVLLLDEPTVGVDPQSRNKLFENILALKAQGKTILYTTHYMEEAERLCDRVGIVDHGRLLALDSVDHLINQYGGDSQVRISSADGEVVIDTDQPIVKLQELLVKHHDITDLQLRRPDMEKVFLNLTGRHLRD
jgi:ABC-2 type transport system ATP-binding protein